VQQPCNPQNGPRELAPPILQRPEIAEGLKPRFVLSPKLAELLPSLLRQMEVVWCDGHRRTWYNEITDGLDDAMIIGGNGLGDWTGLDLTIADHTGR